jgi:hypothetical protein
VEKTGVITNAIYDQTWEGIQIFQIQEKHDNCYTTEMAYKNKNNQHFIINK